MKYINKLLLTVVAIIVAMMLATGCGAEGTGSVDNTTPTPTPTPTEPAHQHLFDEFVEDSQPDCVNDGYTVYKCECGETKKEVYQTAYGHDYNEMTWECRNCGHVVVGLEAPEVCPVCNHPQAYFEVRKENY